MSFTKQLCFMLIVLCGFNSITLGAEEFPQFRGPQGQGHAEASNLPTTWSETENIAWKAAVPGKGHSSPVISGSQIWLTTAVVQELTEAEKKAKLAQIPNSNSLELVGQVSLQAVCFDRNSGQLVRTVNVFQVDSPEPIHSLNSYASPTPVLEGGRLYCHFGLYGTACVDTATGTTVWKNQTLQVNYQNGAGSSPILWGNLLIIHFDGIDHQYLAAFDKSSGEVKWKTKRTGEMNPKPEMQKAYCTPLVVADENGVQLISPAADWVYSYNPATGDELWKAKYGKLGFSTVPRPVVGHGMAFICTSYMQSVLLAVKYDGRGDVTNSHIVWKSDKQIPKKPSLMLVGDELYVVSDAGIASCLDAKTGQEHWRERLTGNYSASPLMADGKIYFCDQEGKTVVIAPGKTYQKLSENTLSSGCMASPVAVDQALYLRTDTHLYRIQQAAQK